MHLSTLTGLFVALPGLTVAVPLEARQACTRPYCVGKDFFAHCGRDGQVDYVERCRNCEVVELGPNPNSGYGVLCDPEPTDPTDGPDITVTRDPTPTGDSGITVTRTVIPPAARSALPMAPDARANCGKPYHFLCNGDTASFCDGNGQIAFSQECLNCRIINIGNIETPECGPVRGGTPTDDPSITVTRGGTPTESTLITVTRST